MASSDLHPGLKGQKQTIVCDHNVAGHVAKFSTPSMILLMEQASMEGIAQHLSDSEILVGIEVNVRHLAPADIEPQPNRRLMPPSTGFPGRPRS